MHNIHLPMVSADFQFCRRTITYLLVFISISLLESTSANDQVTYLQNFCSDDGNNNQGSEFQNNLDLLLSNLTTQATANKFYNLTTGEGTNKVYGLFRCNNDYIDQVCQDCILIAKGEIQRRCPLTKEAIVWYTECMLRYANRNIFSVNDVSEFYNLASGPEKYSQYNQDLIDTFISLSHQATSGKSSTLSATTVVYVSQEISVACYVDCTPDLSASNCDKCLQTGIGRFQTNGTQAGVLLQPSCRLMYSFTDSGLHPTGIQQLREANP
ncbi:cysteine-rich repeat secretory protein 1-like [Silene latifolia]|uniref:cysteine-rich repeat secretory protein 1-like n=1 Tax=Silene latifolia TaxID=37657 RepID=UPI003D78803A